ncbi:HNH endonuclease [Agromyces sp. Marseille-Q5079]|uniref:HNH endonuclease n=1 Tax=Agromyces sp. Marseille-Q5079 TaxID=3439059 RepID=UPI003D9C7F09
MLKAEQAGVSDSLAAREEWKRFRNAKSSEPLIVELRRMSGATERCAYCSDSLGATVDHFLPISPHFEHTFDWRNLYWICDNCNRRKGARITFDPATGQPLAIRPDRECPWEYLYLDMETGVIAPRMRPPMFEPDERAAETLRVLPVLGFEPVIEGRRREIRRLREVGNSAVTTRGTDEVRALVLAFKEEHHGVKSWIAHHEGSDESPWRELKRQAPHLWRRLVITSVSD